MTPSTRKPPVALDLAHLLRRLQQLNRLADALLTNLHRKP